jgi:drug/metabolite transporter (DMT)-like permease
MIALCSGVLFAVNTKLLQKLGGANSIGLISICNLCAAPLIWLLVPKTAHFSQISASGWLILVIMGIFQLGIPYALYTIGLRSTTPQKATMVALVEPTFNPVWVLLFLGEIPTVYAIVGGVLILTGLVVDTLFSPSAPTMSEEKKENIFPL